MICCSLMVFFCFVLMPCFLVTYGTPCSRLRKKLNYRWLLLLPLEFNLIFQNTNSIYEYNSYFISDDLLFVKDFDALFFIDTWGPGLPL